MFRTLRILLLSAVVATGCGDVARRVVSTVIVTAGTGVRVLHEEHQRVYSARAAEVRTQLQASHGSVEDYDRIMVPVNEVFRHRSQAIQTLDAALYAAAGIVDATRAGANRTDYLTAAQTVLVAIERATAAIRDGAVLPPVTLPREVDLVIGQLRALLGAFAPLDAGQDENGDTM